MWFADVKIVAQRDEGTYPKPGLEKFRISDS